MSLATPSERPGRLRALERLGRVEAPGSAPRSAVVFHLEYQSAASGGSRLAAKLFLPEGKPPAAGWPVSVFSHGVGDPALPFRSWPLSGDSRRGDFGFAAGGWAHHGFATLVPWLPGAGESEPLMSYSPLSLPRNAQAIADGFAALREVPERFSREPALLFGTALEPALDFGRQVLRTDCMSSAVLIHLLADFAKAPALAGLRALVADDFQPSIAYNAHYLVPLIERLPGRLYAGIRALWSRVYWALADERAWPLELFFTPQAIALFGEVMPTAVGPRPRIYNSLLLPPARSELGAALFAAVERALGHAPSAIEVRDWTHAPALIEMAHQPSLERLLAYPLYRERIAPSDPYFAENIAPFDPGIPLQVVVRGGAMALSDMGLPGHRDRSANMVLPKINTLRSWGWSVEVVELGAPAGTSFSGGTAQRAVLQRLSQIL